MEWIISGIVFVSVFLGGWYALTRLDRGYRAYRAEKEAQKRIREMGGGE